VASLTFPPLAKYPIKIGVNTGRTN